MMENKWSNDCLNQFYFSAQGPCFSPKHAFLIYIPMRHTRYRFSHKGSHFVCPSLRIILLVIVSKTTPQPPASSGVQVSRSAGCSHGTTARRDFYFTQFTSAHFRWEIANIHRIKNFVHRTQPVSGRAKTRMLLFLLPIDD